MFIKNPVQNEIIIQKSRFICYLKKVDSVDEYKDYLKQIRKNHYDATHVCSACIIDDFKKASDDGEPSGTAGMPILNVLDKNQMDHIAALVVRYFGGIKLGAGGLIRAYSNATKEALNRAQKYIDVYYPLFTLKLDYEKANRLKHPLELNSIFMEIAYDEMVTFTFALKDESYIETIKEYSKGEIPVSIGSKVIQKVVE